MAYLAQAVVLQGTTSPTTLLTVPAGKHAVIATFRISTTSPTAKAVKVYCTSGDTFDNSVCVFSAAIDSTSPVQWSGDILPAGWKLAVEGDGVVFFCSYWLS